MVWGRWGMFHHGEVVSVEGGLQRNVITRATAQEGQSCKSCLLPIFLSWQIPDIQQRSAGCRLEPPLARTDLSNSSVSLKLPKPKPKSSGICFTEMFLCCIRSLQILNEACFLSRNIFSVLRVPWIVH